MSRCHYLRFDRFTEAFEHVSGVIDDIYKVLTLCSDLSLMMHCGCIYLISDDDVFNNIPIETLQ